MASASKSSAKEVAAKVRGYLAAQPPGTRKALKQVREAILAVAPAAEEAFGVWDPRLQTRWAGPHLVRRLAKPHQPLSAERLDGAHTRTSDQEL